MICLKCGIIQISILHLLYGFLPPKVSVRFLLSVSILRHQKSYSGEFLKICRHLSSQYFNNSPFLGYHIEAGKHLKLGQNNLKHQYMYVVPHFIVFHLSVCMVFRLDIIIGVSDRESVTLIAMMIVNKASTSSLQVHSVH